MAFFSLLKIYISVLLYKKNQLYLNKVLAGNTLTL